MKQADFEAQLKSDGYADLEAKTLDPRPSNTEHAHDYDIRGPVLDGVFTVWQADQPVSYRAGQVFAVPAGKKHSEEIGPEGARILVARKYH
jgi:quercetin dioxygenase-like cupin family protein